MKNWLETAIQQVRFPEPLTVSEWADKYRILGLGSSPEPGRWRTSRTPYLREPMAEFTNPLTKTIVLMCSSQVGKSELLNNIIGYTIHWQPRPILMLQPTLEMAQDYSKRRIATMIRDCPVLKERVSESKAKTSSNTLLLKLFPGGSLALSGANSPAGLASRPIAVLLADEIDRFPASAGGEGDPLDIAEKRTTTFYDSKIVLTSTPGIEGQSRIALAFAETDQRYYHVPCPSCGEWQRLEWKQLLYPNKGGDGAEPNNAYYQCAYCGAAWTQGMKNELLAKGKWIPTGVFSSKAGFHINELYSPWRRWDEVAQKYEDARMDDSRLQVWWNTSLGLPYTANTQTRLDWEAVRDRAKTSDYSEWEVPEDALLLTCGVDVQADRLEYSIWGWGEGERGWLIAHSFIPGEPTDDAVWQNLEKITSRWYNYRAICKTCIDSGSWTQEVYYQCKKRRHYNWVAVKGRSQGVRFVSQPTYVDLNVRGQYSKRGMQVWLIGVDYAKTALFQRIKLPNGNKSLQFPNNMEDFYFASLLSEVPVAKIRKGAKSIVWELIPGRRNEALDCFVYALAGATMLNFTNTNWKKLRASYNKRKEADLNPPPEDEDVAPKPKEQQKPTPYRRITHVKR